jgi:hypothetical protein
MERKQNHREEENIATFFLRLQATVVLYSSSSSLGVDDL